MKISVLNSSKLYLERLMSVNWVELSSRLCSLTVILLRKIRSWKGRWRHCGKSFWSSCRMLLEMSLGRLRWWSRHSIKSCWSVWVFAYFVITETEFVKFLDPEGRSPNDTLVVVVVVVRLLVLGISSLKIPKAFSICSAAQQNFAYSFYCSYSLPIYCLRFFSYFLINE